MSQQPKASGGFAPDPLTKSSATGPRCGLCFQTPVIGSRYRARHRNSPGFSDSSDLRMLELCLLQLPLLYRIVS